MTGLTLATDHGFVLAPNFGFKPDDPIHPWIAEHYGKESAMLIPVLSRPRSRGYLKLRSADPFAHPIIQPHYLTEQHDVDTLVAGLQLSLKLLKPRTSTSLRTGLSSCG